MNKIKQTYGQELLYWHVHTVLAGHISQVLQKVPHPRVGIDLPFLDLEAQYARFNTSSGPSVHDNAIQIQENLNRQHKQEFVNTSSSL